MDYSNVGSAALTGKAIYTKSLISRNYRAGRGVDFRGG
jgi:hypothetical protein